MRLGRVLGTRAGCGASVGLSGALVAVMAAAAAGQSCPPYVTAGYLELPRQTPPKILAIEHAEGVSRISGEFTFPGHETGNWLAIDDGSGLRPVIPDVRAFGIRTLPMASGSETFVYGHSQIVSRWSGTALEDLGRGIGLVHTIEAFDDGSGPTLYAGGSLRIDRVDGNVARWTGEKWEFPGAGLDERIVYTLAVFDDGSGPALYAGGRFDSAGAFPGDSLARWDGAQWSYVDGPRGIVNELKVVELEGRPILVAAGMLAFPEEGWGSLAATWDGETWRPVGDPGYRWDFGSGPAGSKTPIRTMTPIVRDGTLMIYVSGEFSLRWPSRPGVFYSAVFDGEQWYGLLPDQDIVCSAPTPDGQAFAVGGVFERLAGFSVAGLATVTPCTCRADLDGDGELTFFDFLAFQDLFAAGDLRADFDGDGELTFFDFLAFQNEFAAGCP